MTELKVFPDRYDGGSVAAEIQAGRLRSAGDQAVIELPFGEDGEFEIVFENDGLPIDESLLTQARLLMFSVGKLDNQVQESCAEECRRTGLHPRNFESMLACVKLSPNVAKLHYFGAGVNTEWDELAEFSNGSWHYVGTASYADKAP